MNEETVNVRRTIAEYMRSQLGKRMATSAAGMLLLLCQLGSVAGQGVSKGTVQGAVVNADSGDPVVGAQVRLWRDDVEPSLIQTATLDLY